MASLLKGSGLKDRATHPYDCFWDLRLGIATFGYHPAVGIAGHPNYRVHYTPVPYGMLFRILRRVRLAANDVFVDLGCGLGRTVFAASWLGARRAIGVEIEPSLVDQADCNRNTSRWRDRDVVFVCQSAENHPHAETTVIFMFHPFGEGTMTKVIHSLDRTLSRTPRQLRIAYVNPVHARVLDASEQLVRIDHWPARPNSLSRNGRYAVGFWAMRSEQDRARQAASSAWARTSAQSESSP